MRIGGVARESDTAEPRVAATPETVKESSRRWERPDGEPGAGVKVRHSR